MKPTLFYSEKLMLYDFGPSHPFRPEHFREFIEYLRENDRLKFFDVIEPHRAADEELETVHKKEYLDSLKAMARLNGFVSPDTPVSESLLEGGRYLAGSAIDAMDRVRVHGGNTVTLGGLHHAGPDYGEGFCIINDVAIAAKRALDKGIKRVLILDTDAHQGNGTMDTFWEEPRVLFISIHQDPRTLYPGRGFTWEIGGGEGEGYTINLPMPRYSGDGQYRRAFEDIIIPVAEQFKPELVIRNGGTDPHYSDRLTELGMTLDGFHHIGERTGEIVRHSRGLVDMTISGYNPVTVEGWDAIISGSNGLPWEKPEEPYNESGDWVNEERLNRQVDEVIERLRAKLNKWWGF